MRELREAEIKSGFRGREGLVSERVGNVEGGHICACMYALTNAGAEGTGYGVGRDAVVQRWISREICFWGYGWVFHVDFRALAEKSWGRKLIVPKREKSDSDVENIDYYRYPNSRLAIF